MKVELKRLPRTLPRRFRRRGAAGDGRGTSRSACGHHDADDRQAPRTRAFRHGDQKAAQVGQMGAQGFVHDHSAGTAPRGDVGDAVASGRFDHVLRRGGAAAAELYLHRVEVH